MRPARYSSSTGHASAGPTRPKYRPSATRRGCPQTGRRPRARLPHPVVLRVLPQRLVERPAVPARSTVVLPVGADEQQRVTDRFAGRVQVEVEHLLVTPDLARGRARARPRSGERRRRASCEAAALGAADEEDSRSGGRPRSARRCPFTWSESPAPQPRPAPEPPVLDQDPVSTRLAVPASGSSFSTRDVRRAPTHGVEGCWPQDATRRSPARSDRLPGATERPAPRPARARRSRSPSSSPRRRRSPVRPRPIPSATRPRAPCPASG